MEKEDSFDISFEKRQNEDKMQKNNDAETEVRKKISCIARIIRTCSKPDTLIPLLKLKIVMEISCLLDDDFAPD